MAFNTKPNMNFAQGRSGGLKWNLIMAEINLKLDLNLV